MDVIVKGQPSIEVRMEAKVVDSYKTADAALSESSVNPVQNKVVTAELGEKATKTELSALETKVTENKTATDTAVSDLSAKVDEEVESVQTQLDSHDVAIEDLQDNKVDKGDYAPALTSGFADNLVGSDVIVDKDFTIRKSGDGAILDGAARMEVVKGNSVVWNQHIKGIIKSVSGLSISISDDDIISINGTATSALVNIFDTDYGVGGDALKNAPLGRYVLDVKIIDNPDNLSVNIFAFNGRISFPNTGNYTTSYQKIGDCSSLSVGGGFGISSYGGIGTVFNNVRFKVSLYNLTQMFGAGNEPTTIEEFYARCPQNVDMNAYNEGEVIHCNVDAVKSVGRNVWDEEWEIGQINVLTGVVQTSNNSIRSKNFCDCLPNETFYAYCAGYSNEYYLGIVWYDADYNYVGYNYAAGRTRQVPSNARYFKLTTNTSSQVNYGTTYNHDICINLSDPDFNGKYEPYKEDIKEIPTAIKEAFPEGMMSAGTAHDVAYNDMNKEVGVTEKRIGVVDMGTLNWAYDTTYGSFNLRATVSSLGFKGSSDTMLQANMVCSKYTTSPHTGTGSTIDKTVKIYMSEQLRVLDSSYTDAASFKEEMQGVMLYYELAEPIVTEHDEPFNLDYQVANGGQEQAIANKKTSAFKAKIAYGFNAAAKIKENANEIENLKAIITQLQAAIASMVSTTTEEVE